MARLRNGFIATLRAPVERMTKNEGFPLTEQGGGFDRAAY